MTGNCYNERNGFKNKKITCIFIRFFSSLVLLFLLSFLEYYPFNNIWNPPVTELKQQEFNQREEAIKQNFPQGRKLKY